MVMSIPSGVPWWLIPRAWPPVPQPGIMVLHPAIHMALPPQLLPPRRNTGRLQAARRRAVGAWRLAVRHPALHRPRANTMLHLVVRRQAQGRCRGGPWELPDNSTRLRPPPWVARRAPWLSMHRHRGTAPGPVWLREP